MLTSDGRIVVRSLEAAALGTGAAFTVHAVALVAIAGYFRPRAPINEAQRDLHGDLLISVTLGALALWLVATLWLTFRLQASPWLAIPSAVFFAGAFLLPYGLAFNSLYPDVVRS